MAGRAGIGAGALFLYVETKEDLLLLAFLGENLNVLKHISLSTPPRANLTGLASQLLGGMFAYHPEDMGLMRHLIRELAIVRNPQRCDEGGRWLRRLEMSSRSWLNARNYVERWMQR